jgi:putative NADH-flavin reductase
MSPSKIGVIGPSGFTGSYLTLELLNRGHQVRGISRHPEKLGQHPAYSPYPVDLEKSSIEEISLAFSDLDVVVNGYGPHTAGEEALQYRGSPTLKDPRRCKA